MWSLIRTYITEMKMLLLLAKFKQSMERVTVSNLLMWLMYVSLSPLFCYLHIMSTILYTLYCKTKFQEVPSSSKKSRVKKKGNKGAPSSAMPDPVEQQGESISIVLLKMASWFRYDSYLRRLMLHIRVRCYCRTVL